MKNPRELSTYILSESPFLRVLNPIKLLLREAYE